LLAAGAVAVATCAKIRCNTLAQRQSDPRQRTEHRRLLPRPFAIVIEIWKPHVVVAAIVERDGRFLLVEEETDDGIRINQPAGHLEPAESLADAVRREVLEETARDFAPQGLVGVYRLPSAGQRPTFLRFAFWGPVGEVEPGRSLDTEILRADWYSIDDVRSSASRHRSPLVLQCIDDYLAGLRFPLGLLRE